MFYLCIITLLEHIENKNTTATSSWRHHDAHQEDYSAIERAGNSYQRFSSRFTLALDVFLCVSRYRPNSLDIARQYESVFTEHISSKKLDIIVKLKCVIWPEVQWCRIKFLTFTYYLCLSNISTSTIWWTRRAPIVCLTLNCFKSSLMSQLFILTILDSTNGLNSADVSLSTKQITYKTWH